MQIHYTDNQKILPIERIINLYLINASLDSTVVPFVFDTGGTMTLLSRSTAALLHALPLDETVKAGGNAGAPFTTSIYMVPKIIIGGVTIVDLKVLVVDDTSLNFGEDDKGEQIVINGLLGWDVIQHFVWKYDAKDSCLTMSKPFPASKATNMEVWENMPIIRVLYNGNEELFGFDTGNTESILSDRLYPFFKGAREIIDTIVGIDGVSEEQVRVVNDFAVKVGEQEIVLRNVPAVARPVFPSENKKICGLLAADLIQGKSWTIDYLNRHFSIR